MITAPNSNQALNNFDFYVCTKALTSNLTIWVIFFRSAHRSQSAKTCYVFRGYAKARQALKNDKYDDVISYCSEEIDRPDFEPESCMEVFLLRATFFLLLGRHEDAIADLEKVINSESASKEVRVNALIKRASMYMQLENPEKCFADFELATVIHPGCGDIYHHRGQVGFAVRTWRI